MSKNFQNCFFGFMVAFVCLCTFNLFADAPKKIFFVVHTETINGKGVTELYAQMKKDGHDVKIVSVPLLTNGNKIMYDMDVNFTKKFEEKDVIFPCGKEKPYLKCTGIDEYKPDYVFVQNPYNSFKGSSLDPHFTLENLKKTAKKVAYIVYGPHIFHQAHCNNETLPTMIDYVFVDSESTKKIFIEHLKFKPENVVVSGYQNYKNVRDLIKNQDKNKETKTFKETILWLPRWTLHFNYRDMNEGGSTFLSYERFFYNYAKENPDIRLIVRPHGLLFQYGVDTKYFSAEEAEEIKNKFKSLKNVVFSEHISDPLEKNVIESDIVISDGSSALGEVVVADKPIIYLSNGWNNEFNSNDLGRELKDHLYMAHSPTEILGTIETIRASHYVPFKRAIHSKRDYVRVKVLNKVFEDDYSKFKKKLDPVKNPAKFISAFVKKENL